MDKVNQWLALGANIGVLFGIFFLIIEVQQNTSAVRSQASLTMVQISQESARWALDYVDVERDAERDLDRKRMLYFIVQLSSFENIYLQYQEGIITEEYFESRQNRLRDLLARPEILQLWEQRRDYFAKSFVDWVDGNLRT